MADRKSETTNKVKARHNKMKAAKQYWVNVWQLIGEFVMTRKQDFTQSVTPGEFVTDQIFDSSAAKFCHRAASSTMGALWNSGGKSFVLEPPEHAFSKEVANSEEIRNYYKQLSRRTHKPFQELRAGFLTNLEEMLHDCYGFGTAGIAAFDTNDVKSPVRFCSIDIKKSCIDEGVEGFVDTVYTEYKYTLRQLVAKYGIDNVSQASRDKYLDGKLETTVQVLHAVEPRMDARVSGSYGNDTYPVASIHIELKENHILLESGFEAMPIFVSRFWKCMGEIYGRSPAFENMPAIMTLNALAEAILVATEKQLKPPTWGWDDGSLGGGTINVSAGAHNPRRIPGRASGGNFTGPPIQPIYTVGDLRSAEAQIAKLTQDLKEGFFIDLLTELSSNQRMTLGEADMRDEDRMKALCSMYVRIVAEVLDPLIERVFNILMKHKLLGVPADSPEAQQAEEDGTEILIIPDAVLELMRSGEEVYEVRYLTPAARAMKIEELKGIKQLVNTLAEAAKVAPNILDIVEWENLGRHVQDLGGAPTDVIRTSESMKALLDGRAQQAQQQQKMMVAQVQASVQKDTAQAAKNAASAGLAPQVQLQ